MKAKNKQNPADLLFRQIKPSETVGILNLGCARNLVDAQEILGRLKQKRRQVVAVEKSDVVILNTCGFVEDAKRESLETIVDLIELKKQGRIRKIFVVGCLAQRYAEDLQREYPELDGITGINPFVQDVAPKQVYLTPAHYAYVKICESCYNHCSFCAIPFIKGKFVSRRIEAIIKEIKLLDKQGVKEINLIGQDITAYGLDLYKKKMLADLLRQILDQTRGIRWIRLLYAFPAHLTTDLMKVVASDERVCNYIDIPLQHINDRILRKMHRNYSTKKTEDLIKKLRASIPGVFLRTSMIVGFPGETETEFQQLLDFVEETKFERLGAFVYSREEGTKAYGFRNQIDESVKQKRLDRLMRLQQRIAKKIQKKRIDSILRVLVDERPKDGQNIYIGRTEHDAPEVDGAVYIHAKKKHRPGDFFSVKIKDALEYDLVGEEL